MGPGVLSESTMTTGRRRHLVQDGKVYDVDGKFIVNLDELYSDPQWKLYREDGTVKVTKSSKPAKRR